MRSTSPAETGADSTPAAAGLERTALLCDFDGTICLEDAGHRLFSRFGGETGRVAVERWKRGEIGTRECLALECRDVTAGEAEIIAHVGGASLDPAFERLVRLSRGTPFPLDVVSEGFEFYIRHILARHGLGDVEVRANRAHFTGGALEPRFGLPDGEGCGSCGNCKGWHVRRHRAAGRRVIFVGDGLSDRCGASEADLVFARAGDDLAAWCAREGVACVTWGTLAEVAAALESGAWRDLAR